LRLIRRFLPGFLERVVKRLQIVSSQKADLEEKMYIEDEYLKVLEERDNVISYLQAQVEEKQQALEEKDKALEEKDKALEQEKQRAEQEKANSIKRAIQSGMDIEQIKQIFQVDEAFLERHKLIS
jgi:monoamine oxidase